MVMTASGYHDARLGSGFSSLFRIYFEQTFAKHFLMFAGMLLNVDQFFAEFCMNSPNLRLYLGKILKNAESLRLGRRNRRRSGRYFDTLMIC